MSERLEIDVLTIFPEVVRAPLSESILGRASEQGTVELRIHDLRDWTTDNYRKVDDEPYGGGPGMVMKPEPCFAAVGDLRKEKTRVILMTPQGHRFNQKMAREFSVSSDHLIILCGHYEGIDHRVIEGLVDKEVSIGDYVLTNGELPSVVMLDSILRLVPGTLNNIDSALTDTFSLDCVFPAPPQLLHGLSTFSPSPLHSGQVCCIVKKP